MPRKREDYPAGERQDYEETARENSETVEDAADNAARLLEGKIGAYPEERHGDLERILEMYQKEGVEVPEPALNAAEKLIQYRWAFELPYNYEVDVKKEGVEMVELLKPVLAMENVADATKERVNDLIAEADQIKGDHPRGSAP